MNHLLTDKAGRWMKTLIRVAIILCVALSSCRPEPQTRTPTVKPEPTLSHDQKTYDNVENMIHWSGGPFGLVPAPSLEQQRLGNEGIG